MNNKKGILIAETVKIILAVLGIAILIYLAFALTGMFTARNQLEQARGHLDSISGAIAELESQGGGEKEYPLLNPKGWFLMTWPVPTDFSGFTGADPDLNKYQNNELPNECKRNGWARCICICRGEPSEEESSSRGQYYVSPTNLKFHPLEDCNDFGVCAEITQEGYTLLHSDTESYLKGFVEVNSLMETRKPIIISLENNIVRIYPKQ